MNYHILMRGAQEIFIENLIRIRNEKGLSQAKLAEVSELSSGLIGDIETGRRNPTLTTIEKICQGLDMEPSELFYDPEAERTDDQKRGEVIFRNKLHHMIDDYFNSKY